jgi:hypothetical protein
MDMKLISNRLNGSLRMKILFSLFFIFYSFLSQAKIYGEPYLAYIKPNARLTRISDNSIVKSRKGFYAKVYEINPENRSQFYIFDSSGEAKYIAEAKGLVEIIDDIQLLPGEKGNITYPPKSNFRSANFVVPLESEFTISFDQMNLAPLSNFIKTEISDINSPRFKINTLYKTEFPLNIGLNFNYQSTSWKDQVGTSSTLSIISTGPEIKYRLFNTDDYFLSAITSFEFSPLYQLICGILASIIIGKLILVISLLEWILENNFSLLKILITLMILKLKNMSSPPQVLTLVTK